MTTARVHICWPQTGNVESPHMKVGSSSESHHISAQNKEKHVLATSIFQNFLGEHASRPSRGVTHAALPTTSTPLKISLFANKST